MFYIRHIPSFRYLSIQDGSITHDEWAFAEEYYTREQAEASVKRHNLPESYIIEQISIP